MVVHLDGCMLLLFFCFHECHGTNPCNPGLLWLLETTAIVCWFKSSTSNPGFLSTPVKNRPPLSQPSQTKFCSLCQITTPPRAHHCQVCGRCVLRLDHHSKILGICVGANNYFDFYLFLFFQTIDCMVVAALAIKHVKLLNNQRAMLSFSLLVILIATSQGLLFGYFF